MSDIDGIELIRTPWSSYLFFHCGTPAFMARTAFPGLIDFDLGNITFCWMEQLTMLLHVAES